MCTAAWPVELYKPHQLPPTPPFHLSPLTQESDRRGASPCGVQSDRAISFAFTRVSPVSPHAFTISGTDDHCALASLRLSQPDCQSHSAAEHAVTASAVRLADPLASTALQTCAHSAEHADTAVSDASANRRMNQTHGEKERHNRQTGSAGARTQPRARPA